MTIQLVILDGYSIDIMADETPVDCWSKLLTFYWHSAFGPFSTSSIRIMILFIMKKQLTDWNWTNVLFNDVLFVLLITMCEIPNIEDSPADQWPMTRDILTYQFHYWAVTIYSVMITVFVVTVEKYCYDYVTPDIHYPDDIDGHSVITIVCNRLLIFYYFIILTIGYSGYSCYCGIDIVDDQCPNLPTITWPVLYYYWLIDIPQWQ